VAAYDFVIKQGDTLPVFTWTITDSSGAPINLTGSTVNLVVRSLVSSAPLINTAATVVSAASGTVSFAFTTAQTATPGTYMATWVITTSGGGTQTIPTDGYLSIAIEESLATPGGNSLVSLSDAKDYMTIPTSDKTRDHKLLQMIAGIVPVIEHITGPVIQRQVEEWHDGGQPSLILRQRPVLQVVAVSEFRGPVEWSLALVPDPSHGTIYSATFEAPARLVRRGPGGSSFSFAPGRESVHVVYTAGLASVPANVRLATLELLRINFSQTQARPLARAWPSDGSMDDQEPGREILGFFVPNRVRELLEPSRKAPGVF